MLIKEVANAPWRKKFQTAWYEGVAFHVETDARAGGRRVAVHQYPKRNTPYAEDMGRSANVFHVQGYLIGPYYLNTKDALIQVLEQDGPGMLRLPMPYNGSDVKVMVQQYAVTESREKGGYCVVEMQFVEYGDPAYRPTNASTSQITSAAQTVEQTVTTSNSQGIGSDALAIAAAPYAQTYNSANIDAGLAASIT